MIITGWLDGEWFIIFVPLNNSGIRSDEHPLSCAPPWTQTNTGNNEWFDGTIGLKIFR